MLKYVGCLQHYGFHIELTEFNFALFQCTDQNTIYPFIHSISLIQFDMHTFIRIWLCVFYESWELCKYVIPSCVWLPVPGCKFGVPWTQGKVHRKTCVSILYSSSSQWFNVMFNTIYNAKGGKKKDLGSLELRFLTGGLWPKNGS